MRFKNLDAGINKTEYDRPSISPRAVLNILQTGVESIVVLQTSQSMGIIVMRGEVKLTFHFLQTRPFPHYLEKFCISKDKGFKGFALENVKSTQVVEM